LARFFFDVGVPMKNSNESKMRLEYNNLVDINYLYCFLPLFLLGEMSESTRFVLGFILAGGEYVRSIDFPFEDSWLVMPDKPANLAPDGLAVDTRSFFVLDGDGENIRSIDSPCFDAIVEEAGRVIGGLTLLLGVFGFESNGLTS
jgi:hypothetical protein